MLDISLRELAEIVDGDLSLGCMPSLDGDLASVGPIVTDSRQVDPGDVFWGLRGTRQSGAHYVSEAAIRGAQGTVTDGYFIEPWAGQFSLRVEDAQRALTHLAQWQRRQFRGTAICLADQNETAPTAAMLSTLLTRSPARALSPPSLTTARQTASAMLNWGSDDAYAIANVRSEDESEIDRISHLCCPHIVAITCTHDSRRKANSGPEAFAETHARLLGSLPSDGLAVADGNDPWLRREVSKYSTDVVWVGRSSDCDFVARNIQSEYKRLAFELDNHQFELPVNSDIYLTSALMTVAIGRLLEFSVEQIENALRRTIESEVSDAA